MKQEKPILITGTAGFIGFHLAKRLLSDGKRVIGIDNLNDYYSVDLKKDRNAILKGFEGYSFHEISLEDSSAVNSVFDSQQPNVVVNLAAQAGVRHSLTNPQVYMDSNITGFLSILEACRHHEIEHLVYASSSSVYGANTKMPFSVKHNVDHPVSLYAASKKANELMAHTYATNFGVPVTGLRFFSVYGPWGRPDMALFLFTKAILEGKAIDVYNHGKMKRDFTYVEDIVEGICKVIDYVPSGDSNWNSNDPDPSSSFAPYQLFNIGNNRQVDLLEYISAIEKKLGKEAEKNFLPIQTGDVPESFADVSHLEEKLGYKPNTVLEVGVSNFIDWYREYYHV